MEIDAPALLERVMGIEPTYSAWKAAALPLCYTRYGFPKESFGIIAHFHTIVKDNLFFLTTQKSDDGKKLLKK